MSSDAATGNVAAVAILAGRLLRCCGSQSAKRLGAADAVETPAAAAGEGLFLGSQAGRQEPLQGSEGHTVLPTDLEEEARKRQQQEAERGNKREKEREKDKC